MSRLPSSSEQGFTLVETLIAVAIVTLAVAGPLYGADRAFVAAEISRDNLTAVYLAQEGIEYVRAMRDDEYLAAYAANGPTVSSTAWTNFLSGSDSASITKCVASLCTLDTYPTVPMGTGVGESLATCSGSSCTPLYLANGLYTQQSSLLGATKTIFTRTIQAIALTPTEEKIVSKVTWSNHGTLYTTTVSDHLTPWQ